jgi:acyl carrier protein
MNEATDIQADVVAIVAEVADLPPVEVLPDRALRADLGVDSLAMVEVVVAVEEKFAVRIPDQDASHLVTVGDFVSYVERARST